jgi:hypothetical protein
MVSEVVYHHGQSAIGGHYTTTVRGDDGVWYACDDNHVDYTTVDDVTAKLHYRHAYLLAYELRLP